jgi:ketosteroid isomerase-like protein
VQLPPDAPPAVGRDVIYAGISSEVEALDFLETSIDVEEVLKASDVAIAPGMYTLMAAPKTGGDPMMVDGKYTTTFQQREDGSWKIHRVIFDSNVP